MRREFYKKELEFHEKEAFKRATDGLFDAAYLLGMLSMEEKIEDDDPIYRKLISLTADYSWKIEKDIREGKIAQEKLKDLTNAKEPF